MPTAMRRLPVVRAVFRLRVPAATGRRRLTGCSRSASGVHRIIDEVRSRRDRAERGEGRQRPQQRSALRQHPGRTGRCEHQQVLRPLPDLAPYEVDPARSEDRTGAPAAGASGSTLLTTTMVPPPLPVGRHDQPHAGTRSGSRGPGGAAGPDRCRPAGDWPDPAGDRIGFSTPQSAAMSGSSQATPHSSSGL